MLLKCSLNMSNRKRGMQEQDMLQCGQQSQGEKRGQLEKLGNPIRITQRSGEPQRILQPNAILPDYYPMILMRRYLLRASKGEGGKGTHNTEPHYPRKRKANKCLLRKIPVMTPKNILRNYSRKYSRKQEGVDLRLGGALLLQMQKKEQLILIIDQ